MSDTPYIKAIPLGGLGQVGGNLMVYETINDMIVVDCGLLFPAAGQPGVDYLIPDINYIIENIKKLRAIIITHGHEDHIGALPFLANCLPVPIYATRFTLALIEGKFEYHGNSPLDLRCFENGDRVRLGDLEVEPIAITHSIPNAVSLSITTPAGVLIHTGDFKLDPTPIDAQPTNSQRFIELGRAGVAALFSDSTNADVPGWTLSESTVAQTLDDIVADFPQRLLITTFSSHIHRLQSIISVSEKHGRRVIPAGRSVAHNLSMAKREGHLKIQPGTLAEPHQFSDLPPEEVTVIAAGCQGEVRSALYKIAARTHPHILLSPGDGVMMSARKIPGNEVPVYNVLNSFIRGGVTVIDNRNRPIHASGHGHRDELKQMLQWCAPKTFVPVHGTPRQLVSHARLAEESGVERDNIRIVENGTPIIISKFSDETVIRQDEPVKAGYICIDGLAEVDETVLKDRLLLSQFGIVVCSVSLDEQGNVTSPPAINTRGVIHVDNNEEFLKRCSVQISDALNSKHYHDDKDREDTAKRILRRIFKQELGRRPLIITNMLN